MPADATAAAQAEVDAVLAKLLSATPQDPRTYDVGRVGGLPLSILLGKCQAGSATPVQPLAEEGVPWAERTAVRLVEAGADPCRFDPSTGTCPLEAARGKHLRAFLKAAREAVGSRLYVKVGEFSARHKGRGDEASIKALQAASVGKLTGMLLELSGQELGELLNFATKLELRCREAVVVLCAARSLAVPPWCLAKTLTAEEVVALLPAASPFSFTGFPLASPPTPFPVSPLHFNFSMQGGTAAVPPPVPTTLVPAAALPAEAAAQAASGSPLKAAGIEAHVDTPEWSPSSSPSATPAIGGSGSGPGEAAAAAAPPEPPPNPSLLPITPSEFTLHAIDELLSTHLSGAAAATPSATPSAASSSGGSSTPGAPPLALDPTSAQSARLPAAFLDCGGAGGGGAPTLPPTLLSRLQLLASDPCGEAALWTGDAMPNGCPGFYGPHICALFPPTSPTARAARDHANSLALRALLRLLGTEQQLLHSPRALIPALRPLCALLAPLLAGAEKAGAVIHEASGPASTGAALGLIASFPHTFTLALALVRSLARHASTLPLILLNDGTPFPPQAFPSGQEACIFPPGIRLRCRSAKRTGAGGLPPIQLPRHSLAGMLCATAKALAAAGSGESEDAAAGDAGIASLVALEGSEILPIQATGSYLSMLSFSANAVEEAVAAWAAADLPARLQVPEAPGLPSAASMGGGAGSGLAAAVGDASAAAAAAAAAAAETAACGFVEDALLSPTLLAGPPLLPRLWQAYPAADASGGAAGPSPATRSAADAATLSLPLPPTPHPALSQALAALRMPLTHLLGDSPSDATKPARPTALETRHLGHSDLRSARALPPRSAREAYLEAMADEAFCMADGLEEGHEVLVAESLGKGRPALSARAATQLKREFACISGEKTLVSWGSSILVRCDSAALDVLRFAITGNDASPYANGFFAYDLLVGGAYPDGPPKCLIATRGGGTVRFNPNL